MSARTPPPERRILRTSVCKVSLDDGVNGRPGPALFCVRGVWAPITYLLELFEHFPDVDIVICDLPGMWTSPPPVADPEHFGRAFDEVLGQLLAGRDVVAFGVSTGALGTLALTRPEVRGHVVMEPFLRTANLWPLVDDMRRRIQQYPEKALLRRFIHDLFGYSLEAVEERDYRRLLQGVRAPVRAVYGDFPLEPRRPLPRWPSLSDETTRAALAALPGARAYAGPPQTGHHVTREDGGWAVLLEALREALAEVGGS